MKLESIKKANNRTLEKHLALVGATSGSTIEENRQILFKSVYEVRGLSGTIPWDKVATLNPSSWVTVFYKGEYCQTVRVKDLPVL